MCVVENTEYKWAFKKQRMFFFAILLLFLLQSWKLVESFSSQKWKTSNVCKFKFKVEFFIQSVMVIFTSFKRNHSPLSQSPVGCEVHKCKDFCKQWGSWVLSQDVKFQALWPVLTSTQLPGIMKSFAAYTTSSIPWIFCILKLRCECFFINSQGVLEVERSLRERPFSV
jgi:hypothetical protein